jgi:recombination protein RecT
MSENPIIAFKRDMELVVSRELTMLDANSKSRMQSAAVVAVTKDPDLLLADRASFMAAIRMCAGHGVIPDGVEATLQVYNAKVKINGREEWIKKVTYLPMIRGIQNRVMRSGKVDLFYAEVVYENETFTIDTSQGDRRPVHNPDWFNRGGDVVGAYSVVKYSNGTIDCEPMSRSEIEKIKAVAKTKNVWDNWFEEKAKVAVMKRHSKRLPLSAEDLEFIMNREESDFDQPRDVTPAEKTEARLKTLAQVKREVEEASKGPIRSETEVLTGEVMDELAYDESEVFPGSEAFAEGEKAFRAGLKEKHNPFKENPDYSCWIAGYGAATNSGRSSPTD